MISKNLLMHECEVEINNINRELTNASFSQENNNKRFKLTNVRLENANFYELDNNNLKRSRGGFTMFFDIMNSNIIPLDEEDNEIPDLNEIFRVDNLVYYKGKNYSIRSYTDESNHELHHLEVEIW